MPEKLENMGITDWTQGNDSFFWSLLTLLEEMSKVS